MSPVPEDFLKGDGTYLVEASAGTGKTYWMVETAVKLLLEGDEVSKPERLLAVTFTRAATAELKERLRAKLHEMRDEPTQRDNPRLTAALAAMDRLAVTTIHGFCTGVLEEFALECAVPMGMRFVEDIGSYLDNAVADEWRALTWAESPESRVTLSQLFSSEEEWTPGGLREAAMKVRGAIGARRPTRLADRHSGLEGLRALHEQIADSFDEAGLRQFVKDVQWNKDKSPEGAIDNLAEAVQAIREGRQPMGWLFKAWTSASIEEAANGTKKKINRPLIDAQRIIPLVTAAMKLEDDFAELLWQDAVLGVVDRVEQAMAADRVAGFDDMIAMVERALTGPNGAHLQRVLRDRYDTVLVDEFQDTDWAQWTIFSTAFVGRPLILVGDPKQSIYAFRGADIYAYQQAKRSADKDGRVYSLDTNYRSDDGLVSATNLLFAAKQPFAVPREELDFHDVKAKREEPYLLGDAEGAALMLVDCGEDKAPEHEVRIARYIGAETVRLLTQPGLQYDEPKSSPRELKASDIAVLVRTHKQAAAIVAELRRLRVPVVTAATGDIASSETWLDLQALITAINDPSDDRAVRRALVTALGGRSAAGLQAMVLDEQVWRAQVERMTQARRDWVRRGMLTALSRLLTDPLWQAVTNLAKRADAERRLTDLRHIISLMQRAEREGHRAPSGILSWARRFAERSAEEREVRALHLESDREAVQVTTIHQAKGLEWPVVFCPYLWKKGRDDKQKVHVVRRSDGRRWVRLMPTPWEDEVQTDSPNSERLRLAYVALTRAKARTYVLHAVDGNKARSISPTAHLLAHYGAEYGSALKALSPGISYLCIDKASPARPEPIPMAVHATREYAPAERPVPTSQLVSWGMSSYTALTQASQRHAVADEPGPVDEAEAELPSDDPTLRADQLPGGAHVGNALHAIFERIDFTRHDDAAYRDALLTEVMASYALPRPNADAAQRRAAAELIGRMLEQTLTVPIPGASQPLAAVPMPETLREWRFHLPVMGSTAAKLAAAFRAEGAEWLAQEYAPRLERVSSRELRGFLTGVVDLVARIDGRWWIVDWKSNTLGPTGTSYSVRACRDEMMETHYVLQYHLYAVALHRFLKSRVRGYDYTRDFGGVGYAFLRGLAMGEPSWFADCPSAGLIAALDAALGGGQA